MNIFILDNDPVMAAQYYCDKHVPKMIVEVYQQMGSALRRHGAKDHQMPITQSGKALKGGYHNHPCTRWVGDTKTNFAWTAIHGKELCKEYTKRYGKVHFCRDGIHHMANMFDMLPNGPQTPYAQAMPDDYKNEDAVLAYRHYYWYDKRRFAKWKLGSPDWWNNLVKEESYAGNL